MPFDVEGQTGQYLVTAFYEGLSPGELLSWGPWLTPLLAWAAISLSMLFCFVCLATILRKQWVDNERLTFPLTKVPLALAENKAGRESFFRNKLMWLGFAIPTVIFVVNGMHAINPAFPQVLVRYHLHYAFHSLGGAWQSIGWTIASWSMAAIGLAYFLPAELLFSLWSCYWFVHLENVLLAALGMSIGGMPTEPVSLLTGYQSAGAYVVVVGYIIKSAWPHLREFAANARKRIAESGSDGEFLPPRVALYGLLVASAFCVWWFMQLGMSPLIAVLELMVYLFVMVPMMARNTAEAGMLTTTASFQPLDLVRLVSPRASLGARNLTGLALADTVFTHDMRGNLLSTFLDGLKMSDAVKLDRRGLLYGIIIAVFVALLVGGYLHAVYPYRQGALTMDIVSYQKPPVVNFVRNASLLQVADKYDPRLPVFFASGVGIATILSILRTRYVWWPLAPLAFALAGTWTVTAYWFAFLVAWLIKTIITRYGGWVTYTRLQPFFLGLILGEFSQAVIWASIGGIWRLPTASFPWP